MGVRAGNITPQTADEEHFRERFALPGMSEEAKALWSKSGGVKRPITLKYDDENVDPSNEFEENKGEENEGDEQ